MAGTTKQPEDAFNFHLVGNRDVPFLGYNSAQDPTNLSPQFLVQGSKNVYLKNTGDVSVRPGLLRIGEAETTENGVVASYEFEIPISGLTLPIWVLEDGKMQFRYNDVWYDLRTFDKTRFAFSPWWDATSNITQLIMVNGDPNLYHWSGAIMPITADYQTDVAILATGVSSTVSLSMAPIDSDNTHLEFSSNDLDSLDSRTAVVFRSNPFTSESDFTYVISQNSPFKSGTVIISFVGSLSGLSAKAAQAYIVIGATPEATAQNLLDFLQDPGNTSASNFLGITDSNTIDAVDAMTYESVPTLACPDDSSWIENGFEQSSSFNLNPSIIVDGMEFTYSLLSEHYLINISAQPTTDGFAYQAIGTVSNTPSADVQNDFIVTIANQLVVGSYSNKTIFFSSDEDFTDFTNSGDLVPGDPDFVIIDEYPTGAAVKGDSVYVFAGSSFCYLLTPNTPVPIEIPNGSHFDLVVTKVEKQVGSGKSAALAHEFITTIGEDIIYLSQDHQLRIYGTLRNIVTPKTPSLSKAVRQELIDTDFTGGAIRSVDEFVYLVSPLTGRTYLYQIRDDVDDVGNLTSQRYWQPPQEWGISRIAVIDGVVYGYSSTYPQAYQLWDTDQWHDDSNNGTPAPYECVARFAYQNNGLKTGLTSFNMAYYEGYIAPGSDLTGRIRFDYLGGTHNDGQNGIQDVVISSLDEPGGNGNEGQRGTLIFAGETTAELGVLQVGTDEIGGTVDTLKGFPKFRVIQDVEPTDVFEYQMECFSYSPDSRWEIKCLGTNATQSTNNPTYLRKA